MPAGIVTVCSASFVGSDPDCCATGESGRVKLEGICCALAAALSTAIANAVQVKAKLDGKRRRQELAENIDTSREGQLTARPSSGRGQG